MSQTIHVYRVFDEALTALNHVMADKALLRNLALSGKLLVKTFKTGKHVFSCGNGGSMCDAMHFAEELSGKFRKNRPPLPAMAISDPGHISCVGNDYGYDYIFPRFLEAHANSGDVLLAITTSGNSMNIVNAAKTAKNIGVSVIALTGKQQCNVAEFCDLLLATPASIYADRVQEVHIKLIHIMIELVERELFPQNYI